MMPYEYPTNTWPIPWDTAPGFDTIISHLGRIFQKLGPEQPASETEVMNHKLWGGTYKYTLLTSTLADFCAYESLITTNLKIRIITMLTWYLDMLKSIKDGVHVNTPSPGPMWFRKKNYWTCISGYNFCFCTAKYNQVLVLSEMFALIVFLFSHHEISYRNIQ